MIEELFASKIVAENGTLSSYKIAAITDVITDHWDGDVVFEVETTGASQNFKIPAVGSCDCDVDWGDGNISSGITDPNSAELDHVYASAGSRLVRISGTLTGLDFKNNGTTNSRLNRVFNFGTTGLTNSNNLFSDCPNLWAIETTSGDLTGSLNGAFEDLPALLHIDLSGASTAGLTSVDNIFDNSKALLKAVGGLENWNVENITSAANFLSGMTLSIRNYDLILEAWASQTLQPIVWDFGSSLYSNTTAHDAITGQGVTLIDGGVAP